MKAVYLLLFIVQINVISSHTCPEQCTCKPFGVQAEWLKVKCSDGLQNIGDVNFNIINVELVNLDLSKNDIEIIESNVFKNLTNLKRLDLSENKLTSIKEDAFDGLESLEKLDLGKNQISFINTYAFKKLSNLKNLKLNNNSLQILKDGLFYGLKSLKRLDLSNNPLKCDCDIYWFKNWLLNVSLKLSPAIICASDSNIEKESSKNFKLLDDANCQWSAPTIDIKPEQNQVVFSGDSITLKCRAPSILDDSSAKLHWLWYPDATITDIDFNNYTNPQEKLKNIKIENRYLSDSGIVDSSLSIAPVTDEHNGQWNCFLITLHGNKSKIINVIVISENTRYCPLAITKNNKGIYTWPRTVVGWQAELPCEGNRLSDIMELSIKASYHCNASGLWENLNTNLCPYVSQTTKILEQFAKVNFTLAKGNLLETAKRFQNFTSDSTILKDPVEVEYITETIENYLHFINEEKELGTLLIDVINSILTLSTTILQEAENNYRSCSRLIKIIEKITELTPSIQAHKNNIALEEFRIRHESFTGLTCTWYFETSIKEIPSSRSLHCAINNRTAPIDINYRIIEASIQIPASIMNHVKDLGTQQLMITMFSDSKLFSKENNMNTMDVVTNVIGTKLIGRQIRNLTEPVYVMLKAPYDYYSGVRPKPVIWDETLNRTGGWSSDGCQLSNLLNNLIVFHCNRLGYYGLLQDITHLNQNSEIKGAKFQFSNPAIYVGSFINIICLIFTAITYIIGFASISMPKRAKHCVINNWFAMALLSFLYTYGIHQTENVLVCQIVGISLHYLSLSCLLWMAVFASNMYKKLSKSNINVVADDELSDQPLPKPLLGLYLVGWGIALIICGISGAINLREYASYSVCFLTSGAALAALFVPAGILVAYLAMLHLLIRCAMRNVDLNAQLSEGTQATENMDLELLEPTVHPSGDQNSVRSSRTLSSEAEDSEHSQITQLKGQIIVLILYLISWTTAAIVTSKPIILHFPYEETIFAVIHAISVSTLGLFIFLFYGLARNDVRSQWLKTRCWLRKRKTRCCRPRSISDTNPVVPTQPLVRNSGPPLSNSQATQVTSDTNSINSSHHTARSQNYSAKIADCSDEQNTLPLATKMGNVNLVVLHRQQYRSNNSVTTYTEPSSACVEMFYNPHQSGVARKFFKKQRRHTKNNNLGPRKQGDGGATSEGGSCISIPRPKAKIEADILSTSSKVNNTNIHIEMNPINDTKNVNILSDSGGSVSEERTVPIRFVIGQENLMRGSKKMNNKDVDSVLNVHTKLHDNIMLSHESDIDTKTDEERYLKNVSQQCSLEYSSELESTTQLNSEKSDHNLPEIGETCENSMEENFRYPIFRETCNSGQGSRASGWFYHSNSMHCLSLNYGNQLTNSFRSSLSDVASLMNSKDNEVFKNILTDSHNTATSNEVPNSRKILSQSEQTLYKTNSRSTNNDQIDGYNLIQTRNPILTNSAPTVTDSLNTLTNGINTGQIESSDLPIFVESLAEDIEFDNHDDDCIDFISTKNRNKNLSRLNSQHKSDACIGNAAPHTVNFKHAEMQLNDSVLNLHVIQDDQVIKKETSV